jgi:hypothetical protein
MKAAKAGVILDQGVAPGFGAVGRKTHRKRKTCGFDATLPPDRPKLRPESATADNQ